MSRKTTIIHSANVSEAWADVFNVIMSAPGAKTGPIVLEVEAQNGVTIETPDIRKFVDEELKKHDKFSVDTTSFLIFPWKLWNMLGQPDVVRLRDIYLKRIYPALKRRGPKHNSHGTYFQRMIQFSGLNETARGRAEKDVNQLQRVLEIWKKAGAKGKHPRHSALQATIFDPAKDHHGAAQCGFPCLQQVSFDYHENFLTISAYYPTQYLFDRGYGNYLGLCHLGQFMAKQMGLNFYGLTCFIGSCHLGAGVTKGALTPLKNRIETFRDNLRAATAAPQ
jgi:thymidylate synthase